MFILFSLNQTMFYTIIINSLFRNIPANDICRCLHIFCRIAHRNTNPYCLQHFDIVRTITKGNRILFFQVIIF